MRYLPSFKSIQDSSRSRADRNVEHLSILNAKSKRLAAAMAHIQGSGFRAEILSAHVLTDALQSAAVFLSPSQNMRSNIPSKTMHSKEACVRAICSEASHTNPELPAPVLALNPKPLNPQAPYDLQPLHRYILEVSDGTLKGDPCRLWSLRWALLRQMRYGGVA